MQLPRGKFRSVIKGVALNSLIQELAEVRYTGNITISLRKEVISLVIQRGRYLLAEYGPLRGDLAWEGTIALGETTIDAILSDFSDRELQLSLEFNEPCLLSAQGIPRAPKSPKEKERVAQPPETARERVRQPAPAEMQRGRAREPAPAEEASRPPDTSPSPLPPGPPPPAGETAAGGTPAAPAPEPPVTWTRVDMTQAIALAPDQAEADIPPPGAYDELALLHMEMSALDDVDVEHIATKIRKNARGIVKKLHLGHLMTEKED